MNQNTKRKRKKKRNYNSEQHRYLNWKTSDLLSKWINCAHNQNILENKFERYEQDVTVQIQLIIVSHTLQNYPVNHKNKLMMEREQYIHNHVWFRKYWIS